jgi:hypothetical protein
MPKSTIREDTDRAVGAVPVGARPTRRLRNARKRKDKVREVTPDVDAKEYSRDAIDLCVRNSGFLPEQDELEPEPGETNWERTVSYVKEEIAVDPDWFIERNLLTTEEWEQCGEEPDDQLIQEVAFQLFDRTLTEDMEQSDQYEHEEPEDDDYTVADGFGCFEYQAVIRELLEEIAASLSGGDGDSVLSAVDSLFEEVGEESADISTIENWSNLLVHSVLSRNIENLQLDAVEKLVCACVHEMAARLCQIIARDGTALRFVEWRNLEQVVATALDGIGFQVVLTPPSKDGGKDIIASCTLRGKNHTFFIEIKHWRSGKLVNADLVLDFVEVNVHSSDGGLFLSTSGYSRQVFSHFAELERANIHLGGAKKVVSLCRHYTRRGRGLWTTGQVLPQILFEGTNLSHLACDGQGRR